jgi:hypothetical protein
MESKFTKIKDIKSLSELVYQERRLKDATLLEFAQFARVSLDFLTELEAGRHSMLDFTEVLKVLEALELECVICEKDSDFWG